MANFKTIHTNYGLQRMAQAEATGTPINLVAMAVGDGNGNAVSPKAEQTQLAREIAATRHAPNRIYQDQSDPATFIAELIIPASVNGFVMREWGIWDDTGSLFAVGNLPETYKPTPTEGAYSDTTLRVKFKVTNASVVTVMIDPNVAVATQQWVLNRPKPWPGGLTGQILTKNSNADGDAGWKDPTAVNIVVSTVEEQQTLVANQTVVNLSITNTVGLAVYIEGVRLPLIAGVDGWQPDVAIPTRLTLGKAYPAGSKIITVQNEPASHLVAPLAKSQNLADILDKPLARTNLGVYSTAQVDQRGQAPGDVFYTARSTAPTGSLKANGALVSRTAYANLFAAIGTSYGAGDGFNTFALPDLRGEFVRGFDDGRGVDVGRAVGSAQGDALKSHIHGIQTIDIVDPTSAFASNDGSGDSIASADNSLQPGAGIARTNRYATDAAGGTETRPRNIALLACIKF